MFIVVSQANRDSISHASKQNNSLLSWQAAFSKKKKTENKKLRPDANRKAVSNELSLVYSTSRICWSHPARALHQQRWGLGFRFHQLRWLHRSGSSVSSSEKLINYMHFHNFGTQNQDHNILLIMTSNAHKEPCYKLSFMHEREKRLKHNQN